MTGCPTGLSRWHAAVRRVPAHLVIPIGFGGAAEVGTAAWLGDKILGAAVASELEARCVTGPHHLSELCGAAVSNKNMAAKLAELLPTSLLESIPKEQRVIQEHDCGTLLEACVKEVAATGDRGAIAELARFLLGPASPTAEVGNPKGRLLELGGNVRAEWISGPPNLPVFRARAALMGFAAEESAGSKKAAEQAACTEALRAAGRAVTTLPTHRTRLAAMVTKAEREAAEMEMGLARPGQPALQWEAVGEDYDHVANLKNGESPAEWFRRKTHLHRCLCAPSIFPQIASVQAWKCAFEDGRAALVRVTSSDGHVALFVSPQLAPSNTKAEKSASELAHGHISAMCI